MLDPKGNRIVAIQYLRRVPFAVTSHCDDGGEVTWDFDEVDSTLYYCMAGFGSRSDEFLSAWRTRDRHALWAAPGVRFATLRGKRTVRVRTAAEFAALGVRRVAKPLGGNPFVNASDGSDKRFMWCAICARMVDVYDNPCGHIFEAEAGGWAGPGDETPEAMPETLARIVRRTGCARALRRTLRARTGAKVQVYVPMIGADHADVTLAGKDFSDAFNALHGARENRSTLREGLGWFRALGADTPETNAVVLRWLDAEIAAQDARRASGAAIYRVNVGEPWSRRGATGPHVPWAEALAAARAARAAGRVATISVRVARRKAKAAA